MPVKGELRPDGKVFAGFTKRGGEYWQDQELFERARRKRWKVKVDPRIKLLPLIGQKFGKLTVIDAIGIRAHRSFVLCKCDCGKEKAISVKFLKNGGALTCGCSRAGEKNHNWKGHGEISSFKWKMIRKSADDRGIEFDLTVEFSWELFLKQNRKCALSGIPIVFNRNPKIATASLDRIDSSRGYLTYNIQWLHKRINISKGRMTDQEFIQMCNNVLTYKVGI